MAVNPYAQSWTTGIDQSGTSPPATKPGKNPMEPSGYTTRSPYGPAIPGIEDLISAAGSRVRQQPQYNATSPVYGALAGSNAADLSGFQGLLSSTKGPTNAQTNLSEMAANKGVDPNFEAALKYKTDTAANALNDRFASIGRYGSGDYAKAFGREIGGINAGALSDQWNAARQRQLQASGMIDSANQAQLAQRGGILGNIANLQGSNYDRRLNALGGQTAAQQYEQQAPWAGLNNYAGILNNIGSSYGSQTQYDVPTPLWEKLLGGGISLLGAFGGLMK